jgi:hypothetical protein
MNGKGLAHGLQLSGMEASDMLDVVHYFLEEDFSASSSEQADARSRMRITLYKSLYDQEYKYAMSKSRTHDFDTTVGPPVNDAYATEAPEEPVVPFDPTRNNTSKGYMEPTPLKEDSSQPFGKILDSPMN